MYRWVRWVVADIVVLALLLLVLAWVLPGFALHSLATTLLTALIITVLLAAALPIVYRWTAGLHAATLLRRTNSFTNAPDILVISMYDEQTGEVAAFEELAGSHGGLGGLQAQPFLLYPTSLELDAAHPIVGTAALHAVLKGWVCATNRPHLRDAAHG